MRNRLVRVDKTRRSSYHFSGFMLGGGRRLKIDMRLVVSADGQFMAWER